VKQDAAEAVRWYRKAAEQGHAGGQCNLGFMPRPCASTGWPPSKADGETTGERLMRKHGVTSFELFASLFADDCTLFFESRAW